jgi:hypothetical protein
MFEVYSRLLTESTAFTTSTGSGTPSSRPVESPGSARLGGNRADSVQHEVAARNEQSGSATGFCVATSDALPHPQSRPTTRTPPNLLIICVPLPADA